MGTEPWPAALPRKACGKISNPLSGTPLARLRNRDQWLRYGQALIEGGACALPPVVAESTRKLPFSGVNAF